VIRRAPFLRRHPGEGLNQGQGLVELALILPVMLLMLVGMIDFGFAFYSNMTLEYATREGARVGSALASGSSSLPCGQVDGHVISAVQRVLESAGIRVRLDPSDPAKGGVQWIRIYKADANGNGYAVAGNYNEWTYTAGGGPTVDGTPLDFVGPATPSWSACARLNGANPDAIGVAISYEHAWVIPTGPLFSSTLTLQDRTVMVLNPTYP
jgi:hypothetical protein